MAFSAIATNKECETDTIILAGFDNANEACYKLAHELFDREILMPEESEINIWMDLIHNCKINNTPACRVAEGITIDVSREMNLYSIVHVCFRWQLEEDERKEEKMIAGLREKICQQITPQNIQQVVDELFYAPDVWKIQIVEA